MTDYLSEFKGLRFNITHEEQSVCLMNLKALGGMEVAELLTYLYDDGYTAFGPMDASHENGSLIMVNPGVE